MSCILRLLAACVGFLASAEEIPAVNAGDQLLTVVSYNMYWWHVSEFNDWNLIYDRLRSVENFDIIGFQETDDVRAVLSNIGLASWQSYVAACPIAWNPAVFDLLEGPAHVDVAQDAWTRQLAWVRLQHKASGKQLFWANTHGPLGCDDSYGQNMLAAMKSNSKEGDHFVMTGDFNCATHHQSMIDVMAFLPLSVHGAYPDGGVDHILSSDLPISGGPQDGYPSDHPLMKAIVRLSAEPTPTPTPSPAPVPDEWVMCNSGSKACCDPFSTIGQFCPGGAACQHCGGGRACECPAASVEDQAAVLMV